MATSAQLKTRGIFLMVTFFVVLVLIFMKLYPGPNGQKVNGLDYLDSFFNSLSKGSAYYIPAQMKKADKFAGNKFAAKLKMKSKEEAEDVAKLFAANNINAKAEDVAVSVDGDFGAMMQAVLQDADAMYMNKGEVLATKYGMDGKKAFYEWYNAMSAVEKALKKDEADAVKKEQASFVKNTMTKAMEPAYNYYQVKHESVKDNMFMLIAALVFYVLYTLWYGFGLLYLFEGMGIKLKH